MTLQCTMDAGIDRGDDGSYSVKISKLSHTSSLWDKPMRSARLSDKARFSAAISATQ